MVFQFKLEPIFSSRHQRAHMSRTVNNDSDSVGLLIWLFATNYSKQQIFIIQINVS